MPYRKKIIIALSIILILWGLAAILLRVFSQKIYNDHTCEGNNIDNIELHTMTDIPKTDSCNCNYDYKENTKTVL
jgi:hypothetical protein